MTPSTGKGKTIPGISTVNYHVWKPCNMRCEFCFATFQDIPRETLPKGHLSRDDSIRLVACLADAGFREINFAGGEPTLCPWLPELTKQARNLGMVTSMVTNGTRINPKWLERLEGSLDYATISIDSLDPDTLRKTGRTMPSGPMSQEDYLKALHLLQQEGMGTKINTVLTRDNLAEDLTGFIITAHPERWKILQVLPVRGQNDLTVDRHLISVTEFHHYIQSARRVEQHGIRLVVENNELTTGSYVMVDPAGRFFDNTAGRHTYSQPILAVGAEAALRELSVNPDKFLARGGLYNWLNSEQQTSRTTG